MMKRDKKVTIKHFLNKKLKAKEVDGVKYYSPYIRITYDRNNTIFYMDWLNFFNLDKVPMVLPNRYSEETFKKFLTEAPTVNYVSELDTKINEIIDFETKLLGEDFSISGFRDRLEFYLSPLVVFMYENVTEEIFKELKPNVSATNFLKIKRRYYELNSTIYPNNVWDSDNPTMPELEPYMNAKQKNILHVCNALSILWFIPQPLTFFDWIINKEYEQVLKFYKEQGQEQEDKAVKFIIPITERFVNQLMGEIYK